MEGFSNRLFPMDRYQFSSADGLVDRTLNKVRLPSMAWQWESDWHLELSLDGQPLDHDVCYTLNSQLVCWSCVLF